MPPLRAFANLRKAEARAEQVKGALELFNLEERKAIECFFALVRKSTPQMRVMAERYGGDVSFNFDSNGRLVWVMALFGKGAAAFTLSRRPFEPPQDRPCGPPQGERPTARAMETPLDDDQEEDGQDEEDQNKG